MSLLPRFLRPQDTGQGAEVVGRTQAETIHRLQVGLLALGAMVLLVGVADMIMQRADQVDSEAVPDAAPTIAPAPTPTQNDALQNAGVVPDLPADAEDEPLPEGPVVPEGQTVPSTEE